MSFRVFNNRLSGVFWILAPRLSLTPLHVELIFNRTFLLHLLSADFPSQCSIESEPEFRKSRVAVIASEPIPEKLEIATSTVKKSSRFVVVFDEPRAPCAPATPLSNALFTRSETALIVKAIQKNDFLSRLDEEQIAMMVDLLRASNCKPGEEVIKEGCEGDSMYIVAGGELIVTQAGQDLRTLSVGDVFGELAILYNCKRTATVKGQTQSWRYLEI
uniref:Cyclic nucleotide-binding domain-containing protein n=1 Tax=Oryzias melastigma TaxID=30732 RepID=A0A3B3CMG4_ORYME